MLVGRNIVLYGCGLCEDQIRYDVGRRGGQDPIEDEADVSAKKRKLPSCGRARGFVRRGSSVELQACHPRSSVPLGQLPVSVAGKDRDKQVAPRYDVGVNHEFVGDRRARDVCQEPMRRDKCLGTGQGRLFRHGGGDLGKGGIKKKREGRTVSGGGFLGAFFDGLGTLQVRGKGRVRDHRALMEDMSLPPILLFSSLELLAGCTAWF